MEELIQGFGVGHEPQRESQRQRGDACPRQGAQHDRCGEGWSSTKQAESQSSDAGQHTGKRQEKDELAQGELRVAVVEYLRNGSRPVDSTSPNSSMVQMSI